MRDTVSHLAADPRGAAWGAEPEAANSSAAASAGAGHSGSNFLDNLVREASAAGVAALARGAEAAAGDSSAGLHESKAPGILAGPQSPFAQRSRAVSAARPLAASGAWNTSADTTTTDECAYRTLPPRPGCLFAAHTGPAGLLRLAWWSDAALPGCALAVLNKLQKMPRSSCVCGTPAATQAHALALACCGH